MSNELKHPLRVTSMTLPAGERRPVSHGAASVLHIPVQGAGKAVPADALRIGLGDHGQEFPVTEGFFLSTIDEWNVTVFRNESGASITFDYVLSSDPSLLILMGV